MHCYFVLAGDSSIPIIYAVERVRTGRSFLTRTVQARQRGKCIFTTTISFVREGSGGERTVQHGWDMPPGARQALEDILRAEGAEKEGGKADAAMGVEEQGPFISKRLGIHNANDTRPHAQRPQSWLQCRGTLSPAGGINAHLCALAYMTDSWFIGTVGRIHRLGRFSAHVDSVHPALKSLALQEQKEIQSSRQRIGVQRARTEGKGEDEEGPDPRERGGVFQNTIPTPVGAQVGMMVSLDHTIYFHRPRDVRADEWLFSEMESPWSGDGRGLVVQRIWGRGGELVATCVQEGLVRLKQEESSSGGSKL